MEEACYPIKLYGNDMCITKKLNNFKCLDCPTTRIDEKVHCESSNQRNAYVHDNYFKRRKSYDDEGYNKLLRKRFFNKTKMYSHSTAPSIYCMINYGSFDDRSKYSPYTDKFYTCSKTSSDKTINFLSTNQFIRPCSLKYKQLMTSDANLKLTPIGKDKQKRPTKIYNKVSKCTTEGRKEVIVSISTQSEIAFRKDKRAKYFTTKYNTNINKNRNDNKEINRHKTKTNRRKYYDHSSDGNDSTSIELLNIIYSDYPEIEKNSVINLPESCSYLKTRCVGVDTSSIIKLARNCISSQRRTKTRFKRVKLYNWQSIDDNINRNFEPTVAYTNSIPLEATLRCKSRHNYNPALFQKCETSSQRSPSEDTSTSFGYFDIKENSKLKLKVIYCLNKHKKEVRDIVDNLKKYFKGALRYKCEETSKEEGREKANLSQITHVVSSCLSNEIAFESQRRSSSSSSTQNYFYKKMQPQEKKYTKEIGTNVFFATIPQRRHYSPNYYYSKFENSINKIEPYKTDLTIPELHTKPVEVRLAKEISSHILENSMCYDQFMNNIEGRWAKCKTSQVKKQESSSRTSRSSSLRHKIRKLQRKSFQQQVRKRKSGCQNKIAHNNSRMSNKSKMSSSVLSNINSQMPCVGSPEEGKKWNNFYIFKACPRNVSPTSHRRTLRFGSPRRPRHRSKEWIVHPLDLKLRNPSKKYTIPEKNTSCIPQTQTHLEYHKKVINYKYVKQNKPEREITSFLESKGTENMNDKFIESIESRHSSFEKCIVKYVNSFQGMVHKIKQTGLLRKGNVNKEVTKCVDKMPKKMWLKKCSLSLNKKTNKAIWCTKRSKWKNKVRIYEGNSTLQLNDNEEGKLLVMDKKSLTSDMKSKNESLKKTLQNPESSIVNLKFENLKEINNECDIKISRVETHAHSYTQNNNTDRKQRDSEKIQDDIYHKKKKGGEKAKAKTIKNKKKNKTKGSDRFSFNKFYSISQKFIRVKTIFTRKKTKNIENVHVRKFTTFDNCNKKIKTQKHLSKPQTGILSNAKKSN